MKQQIPLFILIPLVIFLSSCSLNLGGTSKTVSVTEESLRTGTDALVMSFYPNSIPTEIFENQAFTVMIQIANKGASDITNGKVLLEYDSFLQNVQSNWLKYNAPTADTSDSFRLNIKGKSTDLPDGDQQVYSKTFQAKTIPEFRESHDASIIAKACYEYSTKKGVTICIDTMPFLKTKKPCETNPVTMDSQGAPLVITKVEPKITPVAPGKFSLDVKIYLQNKGKGQIYKKGESDIACSGPGSPHWNTIDNVELRLGADESSNQFDCNLPIVLTGKDDFFECSYNQELKEEQPYSTTLFVGIDYGYTHSISAQTKIFRSLKKPT